MSSIRHGPFPDASANSGPAAQVAVLDAARASVVAVGWRRTTLTDVARRAGVSRMTIYRRWPDMSGLLADLMTREWASVMQRVAHGAVAGEGIPQRVRRSVVEIVSAIRHDPMFAKIVEVEPELLLPYLLRRRGRSQDLALQLLEPLLAEGQRRGQVRAGDPALLARSLLLAAHGFTLSLGTVTEPGGSARGRLSEAAFDAELGSLVDRYLCP